MYLKFAKSKEVHEQDLSSAYGDRDETLGWPALIIVTVYSLTIGWIWVLARFIWLWIKSPRWALRATHAANWRRFIHR